MSMFEQIFLGYLFADLMSGIIHWFQDRYANPNWPIIGGVVKKQRLHHVEPLAMQESTFFTRNITTAIPAALTGFLIWVLMGWSWFLVSGLVFGSMSNQIHYWSHIRPTNKTIVMLQRMNVLLPPAQHARHHRGDFDQYYCSVGGFLNPLFDTIRFWNFLSRIIPMRVNHQS